MSIFKTGKKETNVSINDKTPAYLRPLYPFRAVGECLDICRLDDFDYISAHHVLYELKCPNPQCVLAIRTQGINLKKYYSHLRDVSGCPACKLQFGKKDETEYVFKEGEKNIPLTRNNGRWNGFEVRRVIYVPIEIFEEYGQKNFNKNAKELSRQDANEICEEFYTIGNWRKIEEALLVKLKTKTNGNRL